MSCCSSAWCGLRKQLADERAVPPHIIFSDVTLRQIARDYPVMGGTWRESAA